MILRSLILIILTFPLFSEALVFKDSYCVNSKVVKAKEIFPSLREDFEVFKIPDRLREYKIPLYKLRKPFEKRGFKIEGKNKIVSFSLNCVKDDLSFLRKYLIKSYKRLYPSIRIERVVLKKSSGVFFSENDIESIEISPSSLKREKGFLRVVLKNGKRVHISYEMEAFIGVLKAKRDIKRGESLFGSLFSKEEVKFRFFYGKPVTKGNFLALKAKRFIREGEILTENMIKKRKEIEKGDKVRAYIRDDALVVGFEVTALDEGGVGDIIRVKRDKGKIFKAKVISKKAVEIE